jgi:hypothetical protein
MCSIGDARGHTIIYNGKNWKYEDTNEIVDENNPRPCKHCGKFPTKEDHDACLGILPNVQAACCGHNSGRQPPYVIFNNDEYMKFKNQQEMYNYFGINRNG